MTKRTFHMLLILIALSLAGCVTQTPQFAAIEDTAPDEPFNPALVKRTIPHFEPRSRYGNPETYVANNKTYHVLKTAKGYDKVGYASWYGTKFQGHLTSTRKPYDMYAMTAASTTLPLPTYVKVTNLENGRSVIVKVNDRGPFKHERILDLSFAAANLLGYAKKGTARVRVTAIDPKVWQKQHRLLPKPTF